MVNPAEKQIPSFEEIERQRQEKSKQSLSFFRANTIGTSTPATATATTNTTTTTPNTTTNNTHNVSSSLSNSNRPVYGNTVQRTTHTSLSTILVNPTQQKNPILKHVHNVPWEPSSTIKMDYVVGQTTGVIYLSLRYHRLYPTYIYDRLDAVKNLYVCRVLLVYVDIESYHDALREINRIAILSGFTLVLAWSPEEAGRYLETFKAFENRPPDMIRERVEDDYLAKITDCLTQVRSVNKTDVLTLLSTFGSLKNISEASTDQLAMCPGFGEQKVRRLQQVWKQPFIIDRNK